MADKGNWVKVGSYGNSDILAKGNKRKLVHRDGKLADFHYEIKETESCYDTLRAQERRKGG